MRLSSFDYTFRGGSILGILSADNETPEESFELDL